MDEQEFRRRLELFPVVRPRDFHIDLDPLRESSSRSMQNEALKDWQEAWEDGDKNEMENEAIDIHSAFWEKLKLEAERKVGAAEAKKFCKALQQVHHKLVYEELDLDAAHKFISSSKSCG